MDFDASRLPHFAHPAADVLRERAEDGHDPRRAIEPVFASTKDNLTSFVDRRLARIERELDKLSDDPLPHIWGPKLLAHPREDAFFGKKS